MAATGSSISQTGDARLFGASIPATGGLTTGGRFPSATAVQDGGAAPLGSSVPGVGGRWQREPVRRGPGKLRHSKVVLATGDVTTVAGALQVSGSTFGSALASARFKAPAGLAYDGTNNRLYVSDATNYDVRVVDLTNAQAAPVVLSSQLSINGALYPKPFGLALDDAGHLYVAVSVDRAILRIDIYASQITTVAQMAEPTYDGPFGVALDGPGHLFLSDKRGKWAREVDSATDQVTDVAGTLNAIDYRDGVGSDARFDSPSYVFVDVPGHAYVSDEGNRVLRGVDIPTGTVTTVAGMAASYGRQDGVGPAATRALLDHLFRWTRNLYLADSWGPTIRKVVIATGELTTIAGQASSSGSTDGQGAAARFFQPTGITGDGAGNLDVSDNGNNVIRKIVIATGEVTTIGPTSTFYNTAGLACDGTNLYISD